jgi:UDP-N-acetylmuramate dehydrogenase
MQILENIELKDYTTFKIGGLARYFCEAKNREDIEFAGRFAVEKNIPILVLGMGSNVLVSDSGFQGLVVINRLEGLEVLDEGKILVRAQAGELWDNFAKFTVEQGLSGAESLSGIPGTVGGAIVQNAGAYGQACESIIQEVMALDLFESKFIILSKAECQFSYRNSIFKSSNRRYLIISAVFQLSLDPGIRTSSYHDLANYFKNNSSPSIVEIRNAVLDIRSKKGYVILPNAENFKNAGSFYKNPVVTGEVLEKIKSIVEPLESKIELTARPYYWDLGSNKYKVAAAKLLQAVGFAKGYIDGRVGISPKHSLSIINLGEATAMDVVNFDKKIRATLLDKFGVQLESEVEMIGFN